MLRSREMNDRVTTTCHAPSQVARYQRTDGDLDALLLERVTAVTFHRILIAPVATTSNPRRAP